MTPVIALHHTRAAIGAYHRGIRTSKCAGILLAQGFADDAPEIIYAEAGWIKNMAYPTVHKPGAGS